MATGFSGHFDIIAALITVAAFIALFRFNINVLYVILLRHWLGSQSLSSSYLLIELIFQNHNLNKAEQFLYCSAIYILTR